MMKQQNFLQQNRQGSKNLHLKFSYSILLTHQSWSYKLYGLLFFEYHMLLENSKTYIQMLTQCP
ncbi:hypothetical protein pb186bvf_007955 [Paramecium bursaria]